MKKMSVIVGFILVLANTAFAEKPVFVCKSTFDGGQAPVLSVYGSKVFPAGIKISWDQKIQNPDGKIVNVHKSADLRMSSRGGSKVDEDVLIMGYNNDSYGKELHDENNPLYNVEWAGQFEDAKSPKPESALVLNMAGVYKAKKGLNVLFFLEWDFFHRFSVIG